MFRKSAGYMGIHRNKYIAYHKDGGKRRYAMTLVEVIVAMAIIVIIFAVIVPQIRAIRNSWDSKRENVEVIQNGRVLIDHITTQLAQANSIKAVSNSGVTNGYIQFLDNDGNTMRYEINGSNYVVYGPPGNLSELAGPVSQLQFTCYDACNLDTAITDVNLIRTVKIRTTITNSAELGRDQTFSGQAYLRTNIDRGGGGGGGIPGVEDNPASAFLFEMTQKARFPELRQIDATHYLCAYERYTGGAGASTGWAVVLTVNTSNWTISKGTAFVFEGTSCGSPRLAQIDATNYLCAYTGVQDDGFAVILTVNPVTWAITKGTAFEFDPSYCSEPSLSKVDATNFLCAYDGPHSGAQAVKGGWSRVLTVNTGTKTITGGTAFRFEGPSLIASAQLSSIDSTHHLLVYSMVGTSYGWSNILTVNPATRVITKGTAYQFEPVTGGYQWGTLCKIDQNHYLDSYRMTNWSSWEIVLTVNTGTWAIGKGPSMQWGGAGVGAGATLISGGDVVVTTKDMFLGMRVDVSADTVTAGTIHSCPVMNTYGRATSSKVDDTHFLCVYEGSDDYGWAVILNVQGLGAILP